MSITVHRLYYGPVDDKGILLKTSPQLKEGQVLSGDAIVNIYQMGAPHNQTQDSSELLYTSNGPVIRVTRLKPLQDHDKRTSQNCNITLLVKLSDVSKLLVPLLDKQIDFPIKELCLKVTEDGGS